MSKNTQKCKKAVIRHPEDSIPKSVQIQQLPPKRSITTETATSEQDKNIVATKQIEPALVAEPQYNSSKNIVKKNIKKVEEIKPRKIKSLSDLPKPDKETIDEKITRKVNFPFDKKLYKELISLKLVDKPFIPTAPVSYEPVIRDREPRLEDFFTPTTKPEYSIPVTCLLAPQPTIKQYNGLRLYQVMKTWDSGSPD